MRVIGLINILSQLNPELKVLVEGYEGGYSDFEIEKKKVVKLVGRHKWLGDYENIKFVDVIREKDIIECITLKRK